MFKLKFYSLCGKISLRRKPEGDNQMERVVTKRKVKIKKSDNTNLVGRGNMIQLWIMCLIPIGVLAVMHYLPMIGIIVAFKNFKYARGIFGSDWCGLDNFKMFFTSDGFLKLLRNTLGMNFLFIVVGTIVAIAIAIMLFELKSRTATKVFQTTLITPNFISWVLVSYMAFAILNPEYGYINKLLALFNIEPVNFYSKPKAWPTILLICNTWKKMGMDSIIYYATMMSIDSALFEAADIDGANRSNKVKYIILPEMVSILTITTILKIGNIFHADFGLFYQVPRNTGGLYDTTDVIDTYIFRTMRTVGNMGVSSAVSLLQSFVGMIMVILTNTIVKKVSPENALF